MVILKALFFLILILSFPLGEIARFSLGNGISFNLNDVLIFGISLVWVFLLINKKVQFKADLKNPIFLFTGVAIVSLALNILNYKITEVLISSLYILRWVLLSVVYFSFLSLPSKFRKGAPLLMILSGTFFALVGYVQYFLYPSLRNLYYLGWDEHLYRLFSSFLDPNFSGIFLALVFVLVLGELISSIKENSKYRHLYGPIFPIILFAVFLTYSRAAVIALIVSVFTYFVISGYRKIAIGSVLFVLLAIVLSPKSFQTEGTNFFRTASGNARIESIKKGIEIFQKNPVFGIGFNTYRFEQYKRGFINKKDWQVTHAGAAPDNSFVFVLATTGIIGLSVYLYFLYSLFKNAISNFKNKEKRGYAIVLFSSLLGVVASSIFINSLFYPFILVWIWLLVGLTESK